MGTLETEVLIPIKVHWTAYPAEGDGWNEPKIPAGIEIDEIEICGKITDWILEHHAEALEEECADDALPDPGDPDEREPRHSRLLHKQFGIGGKAWTERESTKRTSKS